MIKLKRSLKGVGRFLISNLYIIDGVCFDGFFLIRDCYGCCNTF